MKLVTFTTGRSAGRVVDTTRDRCGTCRRCCPPGTGVLRARRGLGQLGPVLAAGLARRAGDRAGRGAAAGADPAAPPQHLLRGQELRRARQGVRPTPATTPRPAPTAQPEYPVVFTKAPTTVIGTVRRHRPAHTVSPPSWTTKPSSGVIIGTRRPRHQPGRGTGPRLGLHDHQRRHRPRPAEDHKQWFLGKSLDTHAPMGPWAVTADEVGDGRAGAALHRQRRNPAEGNHGRPDLRHPRPSSKPSPPASPCSPATSSPPAPRSASASASTRPGS